MVVPPQTRAPTFTDPGSCGWLAARTATERERESGAGAAGWREPPKPNRCSVIGQNSIEGRGWLVGLLPLGPFPWCLANFFLSLPMAARRSFMRSQLVARDAGNDEGLAAYRSQQRRPPVCRGSRSHAIGRSLLRSGLQEDYSTLRDSM